MKRQRARAVKVLECMFCGSGRSITFVKNNGSEDKMSSRCKEDNRGLRYTLWEKQKWKEMRTVLFLSIFVSQRRPAWNLLGWQRLHSSAKLTVQLTS